MFRIRTAAALLATVFLTACGDGERQQAADLLEQAQLCTDNGRHAEALMLLDSIDHAYPRQIEVRRDAMHLRPFVLEARALVELTQIDSMIAQTTISSEAMRDRLQRVDNPVEPYFVSTAEVKGDVTHTPGLHARMAPDGIFSVLSVTPAGAKHTSVRLSAGGDIAETATIPFDGELNERSSDMERITFLSAQVDTLGKFVLTHPDMPINLTFAGGKERTVKMDAKQIQALGEVYTAAVLFEQLRHLAMMKQQYEQQLMLARSQQARTYRE